MTEPRRGVTRCADVTYDMKDPGPGEPAHDANLGDLLWDPKAGEGHVLTAEVRCGTPRLLLGRPGAPVDCGCGGWGSQPCQSLTLLCECGEDGAARDHHYEILARVRCSVAEGPSSKNVRAKEDERARRPGRECACGPTTTSMECPWHN